MSHLTPHRPARPNVHRESQVPSPMFPASETMQPTGNRPHHPFIHILDNDSLLIIFNFCQPVLIVLIDEDEDDDQGILQGTNWWYNLAQVCQRWRHLVLTSASYLDLCLVCTHGTPVADMLAHSPPLPLIIDYYLDDDPVTAEDGECVFLALQHRNRVRRIRLTMSVSIWERLIAAIDREFPMLEYLYFELPYSGSSLIFPEAFQAPRLRHLILLNMAIPIRLPLLMTCVGLVKLTLRDACPSAYISPNNLLQRLSPMLHLESLIFFWDTLLPKWQIEEQLLLAPITLPNLRRFGFGGRGAYLEALLLQITAPLLEKLHILTLYPRTFRVPCLLQFMNAAKNLRFCSARFRFCGEEVFVWVYPQAGARMYSFYTRLYASDPQMASIAQFVHELTTVFSVVEHLTLENEGYVAPVDGPTLWRNFLGSFGSVKTLLVDDGLVGDVSRSFRLDEGESPTDLLPELKELSYSTKGGDAFAALVDARQNAGRPVTLSHL